MSAQTTNSVPTLDQYDLKRITILNPRKNPQGKGQSSYVNSEDSLFTNKRVIFEVRNARVAYSLKAYREEGQGPSNNDKYHLHLERDDNNPDLKKLFKTVKALERRVAEFISAKSEEWLFDEKSPEQVEGMLKSCISKHRSKTGDKYPDTLRVRCAFNRDTREMSAKFLDGADGNKPIVVNTTNSDREIPYGTTGIFHVAISKVWFSGGGLGLTLSLVQASVNRPSGGMELPTIGMATDELVGRDRSSEASTSETNNEETNTKRSKMVVTSADVESSEDDNDDNAGDNLEDGSSDDEVVSPPKKSSKAAGKAAKTTGRKRGTRKA